METYGELVREFSSCKAEIKHVTICSLCIVEFLQCDTAQRPSFLRLEDGKVVFGVVEEVLSDDGRADSVAENVEVFFQVTVAVGGISADAFAGKVCSGGIIEAFCKYVGLGLSLGCVGTPAFGFHPLGIVA